MANFGLSLSKLFRPGIEGRYSNVKGDSGGETYCGVARNYHGDWNGWILIDTAKDLNAKPDLNGNGLFNSLLPFLQDFYRVKFWYAIKGDRLDSQPLADFLFACAVNMNTPQAVKLLQRSLGITADGIFGDKTLATVNGAGESALARLADQARAFYEKIGTGEKQKFLKGWMNRVAAYATMDGSAVA